MSEAASSQETSILEHEYTMLSRIIKELLANFAITSEIERKRHLQELIASLEVEQRQLGRQLNKQDLDQRGPLYNVLLVEPGVEPDPRLFKQLKSALVEKSNAPQRTHLVLEGPNGTGKSFMAAALAHDEDVRTQFRDGIFWLSVGPEPNLFSLQRWMLHKLGDFRTHLTSPENATRQIQKLCEERHCLLILDDVWDIKDVVALNPASKTTQLLITTPHPELLDFIKYTLPSSRGYSLKPLEQAEGISQLLKFAGQPTDYLKAPVAAAEVAQVCEYNPLALKLMATAAVSGGGDWSLVLDSFQQTETDTPEAYPACLWRALQVNLESLGEDADYYLSLAVFTGHSQIPQAAVVMLWSYLYSLQEKQAYALLEKFAARGLFTLSGTPPLGSIHLHSFQYEYLHLDADLDKLHTHLLTAYRRLCPLGWAMGPNDGYFFEHLCGHLYQAKRYSELKSLLLDFEWLQKKIEHTTVASVLADYDYLNDPDLNPVRRAFVANDHPAGISSAEQLAECLFDSLWQNESKDAQSLLNQAREVLPDWEPPYPDEKK